MQQNDRNSLDRRTEQPRAHLSATFVQCVVCALMALSVFMLSRTDSALYTLLRTQYASGMTQDYCADGVWTAARQTAQQVLGTPQSTETTAQVDVRAPVATITSAGGEDIRVLDALQDSSFEAVTVSQQAVLPVDGPVTSGFGYRIHPVTGNRSFHTGIDLAAPEGTSIAAAYGGTVEETGTSSGRGNYILLSHGENLQTLYCHLSRIDVRQGDTVEAGDTIGLVGSTGMSTGPHLHFELRVEGIRCDPEYVLHDLDYA